VLRFISWGEGNVDVVHYASWDEFLAKNAWRIDSLPATVRSRIPEFDENSVPFVFRAGGRPIDDCVFDLVESHEAESTAPTRQDVDKLVERLLDPEFIHFCSRRGRVYDSSHTFGMRDEGVLLIVYGPNFALWCLEDYPPAATSPRAAEELETLERLRCSD
jgi:hypothetical protein